MSYTTEERNIVCGAARRYCVHFGGEFTDYCQEACLAVEQARRTYKSTFGPWAPYAARAVYRALYGYACKMRAPVSGSLHSLDKLNRTYSVPPKVTNVLAAYVDMEQQLDAARWQERISKRVRYVIRSVPDGKLASPVLLRGINAQKVADYCQLPRHRVYRATRCARAALREDPELRELWRQR